MTKPLCKKCNTGLEFRGWSKRLPAKSEALAVCPQCGEKYQLRYWQGRQTSEPYQVRRRAEKVARGSYRMTAERAAAIVALYGSVQAFLERAPLVCMTLRQNQ